MQIHELPSGTPADSDLIPFDTGTVNYKTPFSGFDVGENTATFTSADEDDPAQFKTVDAVETGPIKTILNRLSMAVSNIRYIWKVLSDVVSKTAIINYNETSRSFNIYHDETHRLILNGGNASGGYQQFRTDVGSSYIVMNDDFGEVDIRLNKTDVKHRLYICDGTNQNYPENMVLRCGDSYIGKPNGLDRLNLVAGDGAYISIGSNAGETAGRLYLYCSGGLIVNGYVGYTGTFKDQTGKTVTVKNGIINTVV